MSPLKLAEPIVAPCGNPDDEEEDVWCEVSELKADDVLACGNELPDGETGCADQDGAH